MVTHFSKIRLRICQFDNRALSYDIFKEFTEIGMGVTVTQLTSVTRPFEPVW